MAVSVVNQWTGSATAFSSSINVSVANTAGNWLVVLAGWNPNAVANPVVQVCDDVRNYWVPLTVSSSSGKTRCMGWAAPNTRAASIVSVSPAAWVDGLTVTVLEVSGLPLYCNLDVVASTQVTAATSVSVSASCTAADAVFAVACFDSVTPTYTVTGTGFTALTQVSVSNATDGTGVDDTVIAPCWRTTTGAGAVTASWTMSASVDASAVIIAVTQTASAPTQPTSNWPAVSYQLGFGYQPGDPTTLPAWTDITTKVSALSCKRGRQYELDKLQAGTANIDFRNNDGAFDPTNSSSAYAPNVVSYVPVRCLATWNGVTYPVFTGYIERWPQSWDSTRYGWSKAAAVDTLAPLAAVTLPSAIGSEILADTPYGYWPLNDSQNATAAGNASGRTVYPLTQVTAQAGAAGTAAFGAQLGMPGDSGTGWEQQGLTSTTAPNAGWLLTATDRSIPQPSAGVGLEVWALFPTGDSSLSTAMFISLSGPSAGTSSWPLVAAEINTSGQPVLGAATTTASESATGTGAYLDGKWHHHFIWITSTSGKWWIDGVLNINHTWAGVTPTNGMPLITLNGYNSISQIGETTNLTLAHAAIYDIQPSVSRIQAHYQAGATGFAGEGSGTRSQRILSYGAWTQARLVDAGDTAMQACADLLGKSAPDALGDAFDTEIGLPSVDGAGTIRIRARHYTYNRAVQWTLDEQSGTPFLGDLSFDFDPTFVDNRITVDRNNGGQGIAQDAASRKANFARSLNRTSYANADQDAVDQATWLLGNYRSPHLRVSEVTLNPASNPSVWPVALGVDVGDIVSVTRRPTYAPAVTGTFVVQQVAHDIAPGKWQTKLTLAPIPIPVLTCDDPVYGVLGSNALGW